MKVLMYSKQYPPKMGSVSNLKKVSHDLKNTDITFVSCDNSQSEHVTHINIDAQDHTEFANLASSVVLRDDFDIIHAHDFHAYQAAITAQAHSNKPLIIQANETTFDRNEGMKDPMEFAIEKEAFEKADKIIANSPRVRDRISASYKIDSNKITTPQNTLEGQSTPR